MEKKSWNKPRHFVRKGFVIFFMVLFLIGAMVVYTPSATASEAQVIKLKYSTFFFPFEPPPVAANRIFDLVEKKTNGRVKVERFMAGALGGPFEELGLLSSGAVDIITLKVDVYPQKLPLHQIIHTEQYTNGAQALANEIAILYELEDTKQLFAAEQKRNNIKILHFNINGPTGITTRFPAKSLADLKGKKVNVMAGYQRDVFQELGWVPVNIQIPELYESLSRGVIDAIFTATAASVPLKYYEIGKEHIEIGDNTLAALPVAFNLDSWNRLPADVQKAFMEAALDTAQWTVQSIEEVMKDTYKKFENKGAKVVMLSDTESEAFFKVLFKHCTNHWLKICKEAGVAEKDTMTVQKYWDKMKWGKWEK